MIDMQEEYSDQFQRNGMLWFSMKVHCKKISTQESEITLKDSHSFTIKAILLSK